MSSSAGRRAGSRGRPAIVELTPAILGAVLSLLAEDGYAQLSTAPVATRVGVSTATLCGSPTRARSSGSPTRARPSRSRSPSPAITRHPAGSQVVLGPPPPDASLARPRAPTSGSPAASGTASPGHPVTTSLDTAGCQEVGPVIMAAMGAHRAWRRQSACEAPTGRGCAPSVCYTSLHEGLTQARVSRLLCSTLPRRAWLRPAARLEMDDGGASGTALRANTSEDQESRVTDPET